MCLNKMPILPIPSTLDVIIFAVPVCILWLSQLKAMDAKIRAHGPLANSKFSYYVYSLHSMAATAQPAFSLPIPLLLPTH